MSDSEKHKSPPLKELVAPLISGQILFLQVSTQTTTARPDANRNSRRSEVRAKNLGENKTHEQTVHPMPFTPGVNNE